MEYFGNILFWYHVLFLIYIVISDVILFILLIVPLHCLFEQLYLILTKYRKVVQHDQRKIFAKYFFDTMSLCWLMTSFVDVILLCLTNFTTSSFWTTPLDFYKICMRSEVVKHAQFLITCLFFDLWRHFWHYFALFH